jgi:hypothetical protein
MDKIMQKIIIVLSFIGLLKSGVVIAQGSMSESDSGFLTSLPPEAPSLYSPTNETVNLPDTITVTWHSQIYTASYHLQISTSLDFSNLVINQTGLTDTLISTFALENNTAYFWRVSASNVAGESEFSMAWSFTTSSQTVVDKEITFIPKNYDLLPAYPNPFNPMTTITYHLPEKADVSLVIFNSMGQSVQELVSGHRQAGVYMVKWDGQNNHSAPVTSGLYFCRFKANNHIFTQKMLLMR